MTYGRPSRIFVAALAALAALALNAPGLRAQPITAGATAVASGTVAAVQDSPETTQEQAAQTSGPVLPMSMRPFYHVFAAFSLAWLLIFGYAVSLRRRMASLEKEVERLTR